MPRLYQFAFLLIGVLPCCLSARGEPPQGDTTKNQIKAQAPRSDLQGDPLPPRALARLGTVRLRHAGCVDKVAFSGDGKLLASCADFQTVCVWDAASGKEIMRFQTRDDDYLHTVAFSPNSSIVAGGGWESIYLWDSATGQEIHRLKGDFELLTFSPDGKTLVSLSDKAIGFWDPATGKQRRQFHRERFLAARPEETSLSAANCMALSPDGKSLAVGGYQPHNDNAVQLLDMKTGKEVRRFQGHKLGASSLAFSPDGKILATGGSYHDQTLRLWDVASGKEIRRIDSPEKGIPSALFTPDGTSLIAEVEKTIYLWDVASGKEIRRFQGHASRIESVVVSPDGQTLASGGCDHTIRLWDLASGKERLAFAAHQGKVAVLAFAPDGKTLTSRCENDTVYHWDPATGKELRHFHGQNKGWAAFSPDLKVLAYANAGSTESVHSILSLHDPATGKELRTLSTRESWIYALAFSSDGNTLCTGGYGHAIHLWDVRTAKRIRSFGEHQGWSVKSLAYSPDGKLLATTKTTASQEPDRAIHLWEIATGKEIRRLEGHEDTVCAVAFSPDSRMLASGGGGKDYAIRLWDVGTGREVRRLSGDRGGYPMVFSPDGKMLASGSQDRAVYLWEVATGRERRRFAGHRGWISVLAFSPDGKRLASGSEDTTVLVWNLTGERRSSGEPHR